MQVEIDDVSVSDGVNRFNGTNKLPVCEEIDVSAKQISSKFSDMGNHNDEYILKFDEEMETPSSAIIKNYANCVPKKSKICSAADNFSRHGQTDKNRIGKASDWKAKPRLHASGVLDFLLHRAALWERGLRKVGIDLQRRHVGLHRVAWLQ